MIDSVQAYQELQKHGVLLDIRTEQEINFYGKINLPNTTFLVWSTNNKEYFITQIQKLINNKSEFIFVVCNRGIRSNTVSQILLNLNYINVINISDGFLGWKNNNLPITKQRGNYDTHR